MSKNWDDKEACDVTVKIKIYFIFMTNILLLNYSRTLIIRMSIIQTAKKMVFLPVVGLLITHNCILSFNIIVIVEYIDKNCFLICTIIVHSHSIGILVFCSVNQFL